MSSPSSNAEQTSKAIYNWIRLCTPEEFEKEGRKYILLRILRMLSDADLAGQSDLNLCNDAAEKLSAHVDELKERVEVLEKQLGS